MIIKGSSRSGPAALAAHLGNAETNERVSLLETRGTVADDLRGALIEMDAFSEGTRCEKSLYHAAISPAVPHRLTPEQRAEAINALEAKLGLTGHARVVVLHEKKDREHIHVVWSRIDLDTGKSVSDSHNYRKHEEVARDLERRFGHDRVQGAHVEREGVKRPDRTPSRAELRQEERTGIKGKVVKHEVTGAFRASDSAEAFKAALEDKGYLLAQGDRRDFVIVDRKGGIHSLARRIDGMRAADLREFMTPIERQTLPSPEEARRIAAEREHLDRENRLEKGYSRGDDYVSQSQTALKDHKLRQAKLDQEHAAKLQSGRDQPPKKEERFRESGSELTDSQKARLDRMDRTSDDRFSDRDHPAPDRQDEVPGGGRSRGR